MKVFNSIVLLIISLCLSQSALAHQSLDWQLLKPKSEAFESLSVSDKYLISEIYLYDVTKQTRQLSQLELDGYNQRVALAKKKGLDVDTLIVEAKQSHVASDSVVKGVHMHDVQIKGDLLPMTSNETSKQQFVLIPNIDKFKSDQNVAANEAILVVSKAPSFNGNIDKSVMVHGDLETQSSKVIVTFNEKQIEVNTGYIIFAESLHQ